MQCHGPLLCASLDHKQLTAHLAAFASFCGRYASDAAVGAHTSRLLGTHGLRAQHSHQPSPRLPRPPPLLIAPVESLAAAVPKPDASRSIARAMSIVRRLFCPTRATARRAAATVTATRRPTCGRCGSSPHPIPSHPIPSHPIPSRHRCGSSPSCCTRTRSAAASQSSLRRKSRTRSSAAPSARSR